MKVLVINCGSSSLKYQLIDMDGEVLLAKGLVERIGIEGSFITQKVEGRDKYKLETPLKNHTDAIDVVLKTLVDKENGVIKDMSEITAVGHRVVHGGEKYSSSVLIDDSVMNQLLECSKLAPLHNPANITGINACKELMPNVPMVGVFDTAFHQTLPKEAYLYALPYDLYKTHHIRRYGFHGTSHKFVSKIAIEMLGKEAKDTKIITCHLGNGASITAVKGGKSIDTTMGFTPLEGLVMGTRCGDIDPAIVLFMEDQLGYDSKKVNNILNKESGVYGLSMVSSDFRDVFDAAAAGNEKAQTAIDVFDYKVIKTIGAYIAVMGGVDAIVFTAGLGENEKLTRKSICDKLAYLGVEIDYDKNKVRGELAELSTPNSKIKIYVIPTNEELMIARDTKEIVAAL